MEGNRLSAKDGMLVAVDGIYSVGKSTLIGDLTAWLAVTTDRTVLVSEWNSSDLVGGLLPTWKRDRRLGAHSLLFAEAADLAHRCETAIWDHLASGGLVVADRYVLSGIARSVIRGAEQGWATTVFRFAPQEVLTVLVECEPERTLERRKALGKDLDGYLSGRDYRHGSSVESDFVAYQHDMRALYRDLAVERGEVVSVDSERSRDACLGTVTEALARHVRW